MIFPAYCFEMEIKSTHRRRSPNMSCKSGFCRFWPGWPDDEEFMPVRAAPPNRCRDQELVGT
jgi:hypothetical protein